MKNLKDLTPAEASVIAFFVSELTKEFTQLEECFDTQSNISLRHDIEEFNTFFKAFAQFGVAVLENAQHKVENHFKGEEVNNG